METIPCAGCENTITTQNYMSAWVLSLTDDDTLIYCSEACCKEHANID